MILTLKDGCTLFDLTADGRDIETLSKERMKEILHQLIDDCLYYDVVAQAIKDFVRDNGKVTNVEHCDECGDSIYTYEIEVEL